MTTPDSSTWIIVVAVEAAAILGLWFRNRIQSYQHKLMWKQFAKEHGINGNGVAENSEDIT